MFSKKEAKQESEIGVRAMCGIAGFSFENPSLLRRMCRIIKHRGPDDEGYFDDRFMSLGNTRLSIIDLRGGRQPIRNEDGSLVLVYNGEIYNYRELREKLQALKHRFSTNSDTEVIVHAYEEYGDECCIEFNGMFAFALWDSRKQRLLLARDRCGIKPLYYTQFKDGQIIFASEIKAILQDQDVKRRVDLEALHYFLNLRFVPREKTLFKDIYRLPPGSLLTLERKKIRVRRYWRLGSPSKQFSEDYLITRIRQALTNALRRNLISDVPLGILLSGGIDSSAILAFASRVSPQPLKTFTMGFGEATDETEEAASLAAEFGAEHQKLVAEHGIFREYPRMIWHADMPKRNLYPYYVMREASKHVKVLLGGLGGDELFGGYEWKYQFAQDIERERKIIPRDVAVAASRSAAELSRYISRYGSMFEIEHVHELQRVAEAGSNRDLYLRVVSLDEVFTAEWLRKIYGNRLLSRRLPKIAGVFTEHFSNNLSFIDQIMHADFSVKMADDFLHVEDTMSMANSIEARVPLLDNEIVDLASQIPAGMKYKFGHGKYIFRKAMEGILPERVLMKEKQGFGGTVGLQFSREIADYANQLLPDGYVVKKGYVKQKYIIEALRHKASMNLIKHYIVLWDLLAFEIWYRMFVVDQSPQPKLELDALA
jgi:asparagine synthase (glutamine-hydrolysing)